MADNELQTQPNETPEAPEEPKEEPQEEVTPEDTSPASPEEPEQDPENPEEPAEPEEPAAQEPPMSRRKAKRLEKLEGLVQRLKQPNQQTSQQQSQGIDYRKMIDADDQVYDQLEKASQDFGQTQFNAGLEQANAVRFHTRLEIDAPRVENKYSQLNREAEDFNPVLTDAINSFYLGMVGFDAQTETVKNPNLRYADFVDALAELGEAMFGQKTTQTTQNIAKQAANTGLRPSGSSAKPLNWQGKPPEQMSDAELKAAITATMPQRDARGRFVSST